MFTILTRLVAVALVATACTPKSPPNTLAPPSERVEREAEARRLFEAGHAYAKQGNAVRAEQYLSLARARGYPAREILPLLLEVCIRAGRLRSALGHALPALRETPSDARLRYLVASLLASVGQETEALNELERVTREEPSFAPGHYLLGTLFYESFGDHAGARIAFRNYLALAPRGKHAREVMAWLAQDDETPASGAVTNSTSGVDG
jgi:predicted Zn-dependent protease